MAFKKGRDEVKALRDAQKEASKELEKPKNLGDRAREIVEQAKKVAGKFTSGLIHRNDRSGPHR
ncbi:MAG: hypothetical protein ACK5BE_02240 [Alphaproteobacteria bacterium]